MSLDLLEARRDLCLRLQDLAAQQADALAARDYDRLIELLAEKGPVIDRIAAMNPAARDWIERREWLPGTERAAGEELLAEADRLLADLAAVERQAIDELTAQRDATQAELTEIGSAGRVHAAYRDSLAPVTHRSLDVDR